MPPRSHSSLESAGFSQKVQEAVSFFRMRLRDRRAPESFNWIFECIEDYRAAYERNTELPFADAHMLEIGFGAQPYRLIGMMSMGFDVRGIDLDVPMFGFSAVQLTRILKRNGPERALKSFVRSLFFDPRDRAAFAKALEQRGHSMRIDRSRFLIGDAAVYDYGSGPIDFIFSEDVFEHIPADALERLVESLSRTLSPQGLAVVTPNSYTGIAGGHLTEWYNDEVEKDVPRKSEPWEHLRKKRFVANTYLNRMARSDYRELFSRYFTIVEEIVLHPDLGRQWLTREVRADLAQWTDEELFSNQVRFVLRPKRA